MNATIGAESFVLTVFRKGISNPKLACDIVAFLGYRNFNEEVAGKELVGPVAEMIYGALDATCIYDQTNVYYDGSGTMRTFIGVAGGMAYIYETTSNGYRKLNIYPGLFLSEVLPLFWRRRDSLDAYTEMSFNWQNKALLNRFGIDAEALPS